MKDNVGALDCITKMNATMPMMMNATFPMFIIPTRVMASHTQNTPDIVAATVFCRPCIVPPAAKKHPQAMMPAGTARFAMGPSLTQAAIKIPMLSASAISMSIRSTLLRGERSENGPLAHARVMGRSRCSTALRHSLCPASRPLPDTCSDVREDCGEAECRPTVGTAGPAVKQAAPPPESDLGPGQPFTVSHPAEWGSFTQTRVVGRGPAGYAQGRIVNCFTWRARRRRLGPPSRRGEHPPDRRGAGRIRLPGQEARGHGDGDGRHPSRRVPSDLNDRAAATRRSTRAGLRPPA